MDEQPTTEHARPDVVAATALATELLLPSFIADLGYFGGTPTLRFANNQLNVEVWLSIDASFSLQPTPSLPLALTPRQRDLLVLEAMYGFEVESVQCLPDSSLKVHFSNGSLLFIAGTGGQSREPWELREQDGKAILVAQEAGDYAIWNR